MLWWQAGWCTQVLHILAKLVRLRVLSGLVGTVHWHARQVVLNHALALAHRARLFLGQRSCEIERCNTFEKANAISPCESVERSGSERVDSEQHAFSFGLVGIRKVKKGGPRQDDSEEDAELVTFSFSPEDTNRTRELVCTSAYYVHWAAICGDADSEIGWTRRVKSCEG